MALPSNSFMFNYNAKEYDAVNRTFPKTQGQLFDEDLVLNKAPSSYGDDYVYFGNSQAYTGRTGYTSSPFNRNTSNNNLTFIYKTKDWYGSSDTTNLFANRNNAYNFMVRRQAFHTSSNIMAYNVTSNPQIVFVRVQSDGKCERTVIDSNGNVLQTATASTPSWGSVTNGFGFFAGYATGNEYFNQTFYWMYCSLETLSDAEILQVINYNEKLGAFSIEPESMPFDYTGGTSSLSITAEEGWTASTSDSWLTLSSTAGTGDATINITAQLNKGQQRTGYVNVTDGSDTLTCTISQDKHPVLVPYNNLYINGNRVN